MSEPRQSIEGPNGTPPHVLSESTNLDSLFAAIVGEQHAALSNLPTARTAPGPIEALPPPPEGAREIVRTVAAGVLQDFPSSNSREPTAVEERGPRVPMRKRSPHLISLLFATAFRCRARVRSPALRRTGCQDRGPIHRRRAFTARSERTPVGRKNACSCSNRPHGEERRSASAAILWCREDSGILMIYDVRARTPRAAQGRSRIDARPVCHCW